MDDDSIKRIVIVGGGTAGWTSAVYLNRFLSGTGCEFTLVESSDIGTIGVGEATVPSMAKFVRQMNFGEDEFMRRCHATYKLGIQFVDWVEEGNPYWHPFGICGGCTVNDVDLFHLWLKIARSGQDAGPYSSYFLQRVLAESDLAPRPLVGTSPIMETISLAYHIDAGALANFLREVATSEGVSHLIDNVGEVALDERGFIDHVRTESGRDLHADLFIDCTGFGALLIGKALGVPYVDWSDVMLCDSAVVTNLPADGSIPSYTCSTALAAGWVWRIPLSNRTGCGYVYSSSHVDDDDAAKQLLAFANHDAANEAELRFLKFDVGRRQTFWAKNCVAVGLASGFLEPLESTGIFFIHKAVELLAQHFPDKTFNEVTVAAYNKRVASLYEEVRDFIVLHYLLNRRDDQAFWQDSRSIEVPSSLAAKIDLYDEMGLLDPVRDTLFREGSYYSIFTGGGRLPRRLIPQSYLPEQDRVSAILEKVREQNKSLAGALPTHQALMEHVHGGLNER